METVVKKLYEGMFLIGSAEAASDWEGVNTVIKTILEKAEAAIVSMRKWNECKLAYEINGKARGTYILCYFRADGGKIPEIERDVQLCEQIMRVLILNAEHMTQEDIEKETPATRAESRSQKLAQQAAEKAESKEPKQSAEKAESDREAETAQAAEGSGAEQADEQNKQEAKAQ